MSASTNKLSRFFAEHILYVNDMQIYRWNKHDYLGMNLDLSVKGQVAVTMVDYLKGVISDF